MEDDETTEVAEVAAEAEANEATEAGDTPDLAAELAKVKALMRKQEARAKANADKARQFDELKAASQSEQDKAVEAAKAEARAAAMRETGEKAARSILRAALTAGKVADVDDVIEDLNLAKFVGEDGDIDEDAIAKTVARLIPAKQVAASADGQGVRGKSIYESTDMSARDIAKAARARN